MKNTEKTFGGVIAEWMNTQLGIAYSNAAWVTSPVSPVMFSHHTVPLKSMKHCHCIWFQTDLSCVLSHFSLFPVSFYCQKYIRNYSEEWWTICSGFGKKNKVYFTHFYLPCTLCIFFTSQTPVCSIYHKCHCFGSFNSIMV